MTSLDSAMSRGRLGDDPVPQGIGVPPAELGLWVFLATVTMLFAAFFSAYLVRSTGEDWRPIALPPILWANTAVLAASSATLVRARVVAARGLQRRWLLLTALLGLLFVGGQLAGWRQLLAHGVHLPTSPHSAFFYILTGLHALHLVGGTALLLWAAAATPPGAPDPARADPLRLCGAYWHFMGALWVMVFLVLAAL